MPSPDTKTVNGEKVMWYVIYTGFDYGTSEGGYSPHTATIGCAPINLAEQLVAFSGLYSAEKWEAQTTLQRPACFAQASCRSSIRVTEQ